MKANELRVLNWIIVEANIYPEPTYLEVQISAKNIYDFELNPDLFYPIPLTEQWLKKFGFENKLNEYTNIWVKKNNWFHFEYCEDEKKWFCVMTCGGRTITDIKHVHQLQNLYFALTGQELEIIS